MTVVISDAVVFGQADFDDDNPIIGWENLVTIARLSTDSSFNPDWPLANVANVSTYLRFEQDEDAEGEDFNMKVDFETGNNEINYIGVAGHNWGSQARTVHVYGAKQNASYATLLHLDGNTGDLVFPDSGDDPTKVYVSVGGAAISASDRKFGTASLILGGTGMFIHTPWHADFHLLNSDFTIDCWFNCNMASGIAGNIAIFDGIWSLFRDTDDKIKFTISTSAGSFTVSSTTLFSIAVNTGWNHVAVIRNGSLLMLFINGELEASVAITGTASVPSPSPNFHIGGSVASGLYFNGRIDEFRMTVGLAQWTSDFNVPSRAYADVGDPQFLPLVTPFIPADNSPILVRFPEDIYIDIEVLATAPDDDTGPARAAVFYCGELLVVQRKLQTSFTPINMGRRSEVLGQRSERGQFLGRQIIGAWVESSANIRYMTAEWYREFMDDFIASTETRPFFFAWAPVSYPLEVGYAWAMEVPQPEIFDPSGLIGVTIQMQGIVN